MRRGVEVTCARCTGADGAARHPYRFGFRILGFNDVNLEYNVVDKASHVGYGRRERIPVFGVRGANLVRESEPDGRGGGGQI